MLQRKGNNWSRRYQGILGKDHKYHTKNLATPIVNLNDVHMHACQFWCTKTLLQGAALTTDFVLPVELMHSNRRLQSMGLTVTRDHVRLARVYCAVACKYPWLRRKLLMCNVVKANAVMSVYAVS